MDNLSRPFHSASLTEGPSFHLSVPEVSLIHLELICVKSERERDLYASTSSIEKRTTGVLLHRSQQGPAEIFQPETSYGFSLGSDFRLNDKGNFCIREQMRKTMNLTEKMYALGD
ncbi:hypothetical protein LEMLEM_LOCUS23609 [Lemmus lemmus]